MTREPIDERMVWLVRTGCQLLLMREMERLIVGATDAFVELTLGERGYFYVTDESRKTLVVAGARGAGKLAAPAPEAHVGELVRQVAGSREALVATDADPRAAGSTQPTPPRIFMCVPVMLRQELLGVLYADSSRLSGGVQSKHLQLFAEQLAVALDTTRLLERAHNDLLTGLPNQSSFLGHLSRAVQETGSGMAGGLLMIDLTNFRRINQTAGSDVGDRALVDVAQTLRDALCTDGVVARWGADKFALLLLAQPSRLVHLRLLDAAERARASIAAKTYHAINLSSSIGGTSFDGNRGRTAQELIARAQDALRTARERGTGQVEMKLDSVK